MELLFSRCSLVALTRWLRYSLLCVFNTLFLFLVCCHITLRRRAVLCCWFGNTNSFLVNIVDVRMGWGDTSIIGLYFIACCIHQTGTSLVSRLEADLSF